MSRKLLDLTGKRFGRLTVLRRSGTTRTPNGSSRPVWSCRCDCGLEVEVPGPNLRIGNTQSCGCLRRETSPNRTHGMTDSPEYQSWRGMWERCTNKANNHYHIYGGAGVHICDRWRDFKAFYEDMGARPTGTSLDRYPNQHGNYEPGNCRWATPKEQSRNTSRTVNITWDGVTLCRKDWAKRLGITEVALKVRINRWGLQRAMTTPKIEVGIGANPRHF